MKSASDAYKSRKMGTYQYLHEQRHFLNYCHSITPHAQPHRPFQTLCAYVCMYVCTYVRLPAHQKRMQTQTKRKKPHDQPARLRFDLLAQLKSGGDRIRIPEIFFLWMEENRQLGKERTAESID